VIIGCVVCGIQLGWGCVVSGLVCLTSSGSSSGLLFSVGVYLVSGIHCVWVWVCGVCVSVSVWCVCARARSLPYLVYIGSGYPFVLWGSCFWCVCVQRVTMVRSQHHLAI